MKRTLLLIPVLAAVANASVITLDSSATTTYNDSGMPTINIDPHPAWAPALTGSNWVSVLPTGDPRDCGYVVVPDGFTVDFSQNFYLNGTATGATLSVMADDTTSVILNGKLIYGAADPKAGFPTCSSAPIGCLNSTMKTFNFADLQSSLRSGENTITFGVVQKHGASYGLDYAGSVTSSTVPEPASMLLIGAGLVGVAVLQRRRRRAS